MHNLFPSKLLNKVNLKKKVRRKINGEKNDYSVFVELIDQLNEPGKFENCSGTRTLMHNIADLKAQIAANLKVLR